MRSNPNSIDPSGLSASSGPRRIQRGHPIFLLSRGKTEEKTLSKMMQGITLCYTQYFNGKYTRTGRLWECRYHSTIVDEDRYLWSVSRYIENNPVRAGIAKKAEDYRFSSAKAHLLG